MKTSIQTSLLLAIFTFTFISQGCKKNSLAVPGNIKSKKVTSYSSIYSSDTINYTYDAQGRATVAQGNHSVVTYQYGANEVTVINNLNSQTIYHLNGQGYAASDDKGNTYGYDGTGLLTFIRNQHGDTMLANGLAGGDIIYTRTPGPIVVDSFTYYTTGESRDFGTAFFGKGTVHPVHTETLTAYTGTKITLVHTYDYDSRNRIIKEIVTDTAATYTFAVILYEYL